MPVAQRFFLSKMVPVFWCRSAPNCNMLFDCRISQIRTFPTGMTPSSLPCLLPGFPKIQNFFAFFNYHLRIPANKKSGRLPSHHPQRKRLPPTEIAAVQQNSRQNQHRKAHDCSLSNKMISDFLSHDFLVFSDSYQHQGDQWQKHPGMNKSDSLAS